MVRNKKVRNVSKKLNTKKISASEIVKHMCENLPDYGRFTIAYYLISRFPEITMHVIVPLPVSNSTIEFISIVNSSVFNCDYENKLGRSFIIKVGNLDDTIIDISPIEIEDLGIPDCVPNKILFEEECKKLRLVLDKGEKEYCIAGGERFEKDGMITFKEAEK